MYNHLFPSYLRKLSPNLMNLSHVFKSIRRKIWKPPSLENPDRLKPVWIERRLKSWNIEYNFKWNQAYLSRISNFNRGSNSLNPASGAKRKNKTKKSKKVSKITCFFSLVRRYILRKRERVIFDAFLDNNLLTNN